MTARFEKLKRIGAERYGDKNNCAVIALASFADVSYGKANAALKRAGRKEGRGATGPTILNAARELLGDVILEEVSGITTGRYALKNEGAALILTARHASALWNNTVHDYEAAKRKRVTHVLRKVA